VPPNPDTGQIFFAAGSSAIPRRLLILFILSILSKPESPQGQGDSLQGCIKFVNHTVAADVSRLKLSIVCSFSHGRRRIMIRLTPDATKKGELAAVLDSLIPLDFQVAGPGKTAKLKPVLALRWANN